MVIVMKGNIDIKNMVKGDWGLGSIHITLHIINY